MQAGDFSKRSTRLYEQRWMELFGHDFKLVGGPATPAVQPACLAGCCTAAAGQLPCGWALRPAPLTPAATLHNCCTVNASISLPSVPEWRVADLAPSPPCLVLTPVLRGACSPLPPAAVPEGRGADLALPYPAGRLRQRGAAPGRRHDEQVGGGELLLLVVHLSS